MAPAADLGSAVTGEATGSTRWFMARAAPGLLDKHSTEHGLLLGISFQFATRPDVEMFRRLRSPFRTLRGGVSILNYRSDMDRIVSEGLVSRCSKNVQGCRCK